MLGPDRQLALASLGRSPIMLTLFHSPSFSCLLPRGERHRLPSFLEIGAILSLMTQPLSLIQPAVAL